MQQTLMSTNIPVVINESFSTDKDVTVTKVVTAQWHMLTLGYEVCIVVLLI